MTIIEAINRIDSLKPNNYTKADKVKWLSTLDGLVYDEIIKTHEGWQDVTYNGYTDSTPVDTELLVPAPYDDIYIHYIESCIHHANEEYGKYNNAKTSYNSVYLTFANYYNRTHMPVGMRIKHF